MKASELRAKNGDELQKELNDLLKAQFGLRMQHATQQLANTSQIKKVRRDIARVRTVIEREGRQMSAAAATEQAAGPAKNQRKLVGRVVSDKMQKTVVVLVERRVRHPEMGKIITALEQVPRARRPSEFKEGDLVEIAECRPISKTKSWTVTRLVEKSKAV